MFEKRSTEARTVRAGIGRWCARLLAPALVLVLVTAFTLQLTSGRSEAAGAGSTEAQVVDSSPDIFGCNGITLSSGFFTSGFFNTFGTTVNPFGTTFGNQFVNPFGTTFGPTFGNPFFPNTFVPASGFFPCVNDCSDLNQFFFAICPGPPASITLQGPTNVTCGSQSNFEARIVGPFGLLVSDGTPVTFTTTLGYDSTTDSTVRGLASTSLVIPTRTFGNATITATSGTVSAQMSVSVTC
jgi:hypothetical protein